MAVWFDGSCVIDVSDILAKYAKNAVVFQGPQVSIRWPGTEAGKLFYPAGNTVKSEDLKTGVSTQIHSTSNGDVWATSCIPGGCQFWCNSRNYRDAAPEPL